MKNNGKMSMNELIFLLSLHISKYYKKDKSTTLYQFEKECNLVGNPIVRKFSKKLINEQILIQNGFTDSRASKYYVDRKKLVLLRNTQKLYDLCIKSYICEIP